MTNREDPPDPTNAADGGEFAKRLCDLHAWARHPRYEVMASRAVQAHVELAIATSSFTNLLRGTTKPRWRTVEAFLYGCELSADRHEQWRETWKKLFGERPRPPVPPYPSQPLFAERDMQIDELNARLEVARARGVPCIVAISGVGGVGKSTLAEYWAATVATGSQPGCRYLLLELRGFSDGAPPTDVDLLGKLFRHLGLSEKAGDVDDPADRFREEIEKNQLVVVLDDASDLDQVRSILPTLGGSVVIITSRVPLRNLLVLDMAGLITYIPLRTWEPGQSLRQLRRIAGDDAVDGEMEAALTLCRMAGGLPLAVNLIGRRAAADMDGSSEADRERSLARLAVELKRLGAVAVEGPPGKANVRAVFSSSYLKLAKADQRVFRLLALRLADAIDDYAISLLADIPVSDAYLAAVALENVGLLVGVRGRFSMHDLLHRFARERLDDESPAEELPAIERQLRGYYGCVNHAFHERNDTNPMVDRDFLHEWKGTDEGRVGLEAVGDMPARWAAVEHANLIHLIENACGMPRPPLHAARLAFSLFYQLETAGHWNEWRDITAKGLQAAERSKDRLAEAFLRRNVARIPFVEIRDAADEIRDKMDPLSVHELKAKCETATGLFDEVTRLFHQPPTDRRLPIIGRAGVLLATVQREIADCHLQLAKIATGEDERHQCALTAIEHFKKARDLFERLYDDRNPVASLSVSLSEAYRLAGNEFHAEAWSCLETAITYCGPPTSEDGTFVRDHKLIHARMYCYALQRRAELHVDMGQPDDALADYDAAIAEFARDNNPLSQARAVVAKARLLEQLRQTDAMVAELRVALDLFPNGRLRERDVVQRLLNAA
ncbi:NB-ARC domain-containing protein [Micromonospora chalcea]